MRIWIAIPAYDGKVTVATARSLQSELQVAVQMGHDLKITYLPGCSLIAHARNVLASTFVDEASAPKMVFVDADVGWTPGALIKLALNPHDIIAGVYRYKVDPESYPAGFLTRPGEAFMNGSLFTAASVPMGFCCLSLDVLRRIRDATPGRAYEFMGGKYHAYFESPFVPADEFRKASIIGEDVAFCFEARKLGERVWIDPDIELTHTDGLREFTGTLSKWMAASGVVNVPTPVEP